MKKLYMASAIAALSLAAFVGQMTTPASAATIDQNCQLTHGNWNNAATQNCEIAFGAGGYNGGIVHKDPCDKPPCHDGGDTASKSS